MEIHTNEEYCLLRNWCLMVWLIVTNVSEERTASIFRTFTLKMEDSRNDLPDYKESIAEECNLPRMIILWIFRRKGLGVWWTVLCVLERVTYRPILSLVGADLIIYHVMSLIGDRHMTRIKTRIIWVELVVLCHILTKTATFGGWGAALRVWAPLYWYTLHPHIHTFLHYSQFNPKYNKTVLTSVTSNSNWNNM
jgi:hypothetical protein